MESEIEHFFITRIQNLTHFKESLEEAKDKLIFIKATATWCGPCKRIQPFFLKLVREWQQTIPIVVLEFDVDEAHDVATLLRANQIPNFLCLPPQSITWPAHQRQQFTGADLPSFAQWFRMCVAEVLSATS